MNKPAAATFAFTLGVALTLLVGNAIHSARESRHQVGLLSDVHHPVRQCLDDIVATHDRGDATLAQRKSRLLHQRWSAFLNGGPAPEQFATEITRLPTTTPSTRPTP